MADELTLAPLEPADWPAVRETYAHGLESGLATFETEIPSWEAWNAAILAHSRWVARLDDRVVGWAALSAASPRPCYAGVAGVSVYVARDARGRGVGRRLLEALIESSERNGIWTLQGMTIAGNEAGLRLQLSCGFRLVGRRERIARLRGEWRDTLLTERRSRVVV